MRRRRPSAMRVIGLMSGTSADAIDVALVRISRRPPSPRLRRAGPPVLDIQLENFTSVPYPSKVRSVILRMAEGAETTPAEISRLDSLLGELFGRAVITALSRFRVNPRGIALIGSHGQTIYHQGRPRPFLRNWEISTTLQIGEPARIAALTGIPTVADFRPADIAAGGQGAPLVPFVDYLLYRHPRRGRAVLNIGGIANVTVIPQAARPEHVLAFDTGPGNMVMDGLVRHFSRGRQSCDHDAKMARAGRILPELLAVLLDDEYYRRRPPKTAGREQYGRAFVERLLAWGKRHKSAPQDLVRTATLLTALSILDGFHRWVLPRTRVQELIVSGGGAYNPLLMAQLQAGLQGIELVSSGRFGVPEKAKEALAFAVLAYETYHRRPANLPSATGARHPAILGKIVYPPVRR